MHGKKVWVCLLQEDGLGSLRHPSLSFRPACTPIPNSPPIISHPPIRLSGSPFCMQHHPLFLLLFWQRSLYHIPHSLMYTVEFLEHILFYWLAYSCIGTYCTNFWIFYRILELRFGGTSGKEPTCQCRRHKRRRLDPWVGKVPGGGHGKPPHYSCLENPHGQRSLEVYSP